MAVVLCRDPPTSVLKRLLSLVERALVANSVFFKPCHEIYKFYDEGWWSRWS